MWKGRRRQRAVIPKWPPSSALRQARKHHHQRQRRRRRLVLNQGKKHQTQSPIIPSLSTTNSSQRSRPPQAKNARSPNVTLTSLHNQPFSQNKTMWVTICPPKGTRPPLLSNEQLPSPNECARTPSTTSMGKTSSAQPASSGASSKPTASPR